MNAVPRWAGVGVTAVQHARGDVRRLVHGPHDTDTECVALCWYACTFFWWPGGSVINDPAAPRRCPLALPERQAAAQALGTRGAHAPPCLAASLQAATVQAGSPGLPLVGLSYCCWPCHCPWLPSPRPGEGGCRGVPAWRPSCPAPAAPAVHNGRAVAPSVSLLSCLRLVQIAAGIRGASFSANRTPAAGHHAPARHRARRPLSSIQVAATRPA